jgi:hypothetical protein
MSTQMLSREALAKGRNVQGQGHLALLGREEGEHPAQQGRETGFDLQGTAFEITFGTALAQVHISTSWRSLRALPQN